jgi:secretion/DNA translocation related TadE-like protein
MTPLRTRPAHDEGIATVWAATGAAVIMAALLLGLHLGAAVAARHRAEAAADLAALAAAGQAVHGAGIACRRAEVIAQQMGGEIIRCLLFGWDALIEVHVPVPLALASTEAVGRARAGPMESEPPSAPSPTGQDTTYRRAGPARRKPGSAFTGGRALRTGRAGHERSRAPRGEPINPDHVRSALSALFVLQFPITTPSSGNLRGER